jgi:hypothetical protein
LRVGIVSASHRAAAVVFGDPDGARRTMTGKDDILALRERARDLMLAGQQAEALRSYRQFFVASRGVPTLYGVRLSFALAEWGKLAAEYPPARQALVEARQEAIDRLRSAATGAGSTVGAGGSTSTPGDSFAEVDAISDVLEEPRLPVALFEELDARAPATAADCAIAAHRSLIRAGRHDLARRYLTDPLGKVGRLAGLLEMRLGSGFTYLPEAARDRRRKEAIRDYVTDVGDVITLLKVTGDEALAERTRQQAVDSISWGHVRDEVAEALCDR